MKLAIIGSRNLTVDNLKPYIPNDVEEIVSGGARGIDSIAREYAIENNIKLTEFLPEYSRFGRGAPLHRNLQIIDYSDYVIAFWDGNSRGTKYVIDNCKKKNKKVAVYVYKNATFKKVL